MKTIPKLIQQKREQIAKLQAQVEVLEELAGEAGVSRGRIAGGGRGRPPGGRRGEGHGRAGRGANQRRVLRVLSNTPTRVRDIAAAAKLLAAATNQVLMGLKRNGLVEQAGRGLYKLADKGNRGSTGPKRRTRRKMATRPKTPRKPRKSGARAQTSSSRQEATAAGTGEP